MNPRRDDVGESPNPYRGRLAPSPTGYLHLGHASTFLTAQERAQHAGGVLVLRNDDLDRSRCRPQFVRAMLEDLRWLGLAWVEGPDVGGPFGPYDQSHRTAFYREAFDRLRQSGRLYPCACTRKEVRNSASAPHPEDDEPIYPGTCHHRDPSNPPARCCWRYRLDEDEPINFTDGAQGDQCFVPGRDFGDFIVWRFNDTPAYHLACVVDDIHMGITEVVRGADLLRSTARQILLLRALNAVEPAWFHCDLVTDDHGVRLAKRHDSLSLRALRAIGEAPERIRQRLLVEPEC